MWCEGRKMPERKHDSTKNYMFLTHTCSTCETVRSFTNWDTFAQMKARSELITRVLAEGQVTKRNSFWGVIGGMETWFLSGRGQFICKRGTSHPMTPDLGDSK